VIAQKKRVTVLSCPGREDQLFTTLRALNASGLEGANEYIVYTDGPILGSDGFHFMGRWTIENLWAPQRASRKNLEAFYRTVVMASIEKVGMNLFLEDDIRPCQGAIKRMFDVGVPEGAPFTTFFDMKEFYPGTPEGLYKVPLHGVDRRGFWGLQAVLFNQPLITEAIVEPGSKGREHFHERMAKYKAHSDMVLIEALEKAGYDHYAAHLPCLVEHVGHANSSIWKFGEHDISRKATNFPGETFNTQALRKFT